MLHTQPHVPFFRAKDNFEKVEALYGGGSCYYLEINSRAPGSPGKNVPDLWSDLMGPGSEATDSVVSTVAEIA